MTFDVCVEVFTYYTKPTYACICRLHVFCTHVTLIVHHFDCVIWFRSLLMSPNPQQVALRHYVHCYRDLAWGQCSISIIATTAKLALSIGLLEIG